MLPHIPMSCFEQYVFAGHFGCVSSGCHTVCFMAFSRRESTHSMLSQTHSTSELGRGLEFLMMDLETNMPQSVEELQDLPITVM